jgi:hypothetical protein
VERNENINVELSKGSRFEYTIGVLVADVTFKIFIQ